MGLCFQKTGLSPCLESPPHMRGTERYHDMNKDFKKRLMGINSDVPKITQGNVILTA